MSTGDRPRPRARAEAGFTALEAVITLVIIALVTLVIERTVSAVHETERTMKSVRVTAERCQTACYRLRDVVSTSRRLFGNDATGTGYLAKLDRSRLPAFVGERLPTFDEVNPLGPDVAGSPKTGNAVLFVRDGAPLPAIANAVAKTVRTIDSYRLVCLYLHETSKQLIQGGPNALELVEWRSEDFPSYAQVTQISDATEKAAVVKDLYDRFGHDFLWDPTQVVASAFFAIDGNGVISVTPTAVASVPEDMNVSKSGRFVNAKTQVARTDMASRPRMPIFTVDPDWYPQGFEAKVVGASGSRKVWMRLTVEQQVAAGRVPVMTTTIVANTRDL